ncbi:hypothetical protein GCM10027277_59440 [Pseudoduganella ginsengisoli]
MCAPGQRVAHVDLHVTQHLLFVEPDHVLGFLHFAPIGTYFPVARTWEKVSYWDIVSGYWDYCI